MKKLFLGLFIIMFLAVCYVAWQAVEFINTPASPEQTEIIFDVPQKATFYRVAHDLEQQGLISDAFKFSILAKINRQTTRIKVGEYKLNKNMRPHAVLSVLVSGHSLAYSLTVPEGYNIFEIRDELNKMWAGRGDDFYNYVTNKKVVKDITGEDLPSMEGYLFPETYMVTKYTSVESLVQQMYNFFRTNLEEVNKNPRVVMSVRDQVILASIIEKETGAPEERPLISSVFHNRLQKKMKLQSDPTILYGLLVQTKVVTKNIKKEDITTPTPYNTYTQPALPIAAIANPGREALWAAVNPIDSGYYYFVSQNNGTHVFSESYKAHEGAVKKYQLDKKMRQGTSWRDLKKKNK